MKSLLIVESPGKIRTIQNIVGSNFRVAATVGHCFEISPEENAIDVEDNFKTKYSIIKGKAQTVAEIKSLAKDSDIVYISTDSDREGEGIGWHIANALDKKTKIKRIRFQEITKSAILKALQNPTDIDMDLVHAQQARSVLDRLVGFKVSPFLWRYVASKTSAGRVQSIGLRLIVDRQAEIDAFKVEEYWSIPAIFSTIRNEQFNANYEIKEKDKIPNKDEADKIVAKIQTSKGWIVKEVNKIRKPRFPGPVFQTSTLQQFCGTTFGWQAKRTMQVAQQLYEQGLITYHRTDCVNISKEAIDAVRVLIKDKFGDDYLPDKPYIYKSKASAQEAHEGIRPSHLEYSSEDVKAKVDEEQFKLYEAIWRRFVACQMEKAIFDNTKVIIESTDQEHRFIANGQIQVFDGFLKIWEYGTSKEEALPQINEKEKVKLEKIEGKQHFTKPPAQFNDASLVKTLEEKGIGRPSTYASIIETLKRRTYIEDTKKAFVPTELGKKVCEFLVKSFPEIMDEGYTARIEEQLDEIAENKKVWTDVAKVFWTELEKRLKGGKAIGQEIKQQNVTDIICPSCKKNKLVKRFGKYGPFYGCEGYRAGECKAMFKIGENDEPITIERKERKYVEGKKCKCGGKLVIRTSNRTGKEFAGCEKFPKCKKIYTVEGEPIEFDNKKEKKEEE